jgi:hypothetical protein
LDLGDEPEGGYPAVDENTEEICQFTFDLNFLDKLTGLALTEPKTKDEGENIE